MLKSAAADFDDTVLAEAARRFGIDPAELDPLEGFENHVYEGRSKVLRIGHSGHRSADQVEAELALVQHLAVGGGRVAAPIRSMGGHLAETIPVAGGRYFVAAAFDRAPGVLLDDHAEAKARLWNDDLFRRWGEETGRLHRLAAGYAPPGAPRPEWHAIDDLRTFDDHVTDPGLRNAARGHVAKLQSQTRSDAGYGLVHADLTQWNFVVTDDGEITVFDFDSTMRCWYAMDVAVALYYARVSDPDGFGEEFAVRFLRRFVEGYRTERRLPAAELRTLPDLLLLQTIILCSISHQNLVDHDPDGNAAFRAKARRILLEGAPVVPVDFAALAGRLG